MSDKKPALAVGMYVLLPGESTGRIVDRRRHRDGLDRLVKLDKTNGDFL